MTPPTSPTSLTPDPTSRQRVLVVDDHAGIAGLMADILAGAGYEVATATNGLEALDVAASLRPDVVLLDWTMPVLDGPGFAAAYRQTPSPHARLIVCTAASSAATRAAEIHADGFLPKPFEMRDLISVVARALSR